MASEKLKPELKGWRSYRFEYGSGMPVQYEEEKTLTEVIGHPFEEIGEGCYHALSINVDDGSQLLSQITS